MNATIRDLERAAATGDEAAANKLVRERARAAGAQPVHIANHHGWCRVIDMTNAGKRGKTCREFVAHDVCAPSNLFDGLERAENFDAALAFVLEIKARRESSTFSVRQGEIRGVDAPKPRLVAGNGAWSAKADEDGVSVADLTDRFNEPRSITGGRQTNASAYAKAKKVWARLESVQSYSEALSILHEAGVRLHSYCAVD